MPRVIGPVRDGGSSKPTVVIGAGIIIGSRGAENGRSFKVTVNGHSGILNLYVPKSYTKAQAAHAALVGA
jgi:hypothetical protein